MKPSSRVIADTGRSSGKVIRQKRCHPFAPSIAAASKMSVEMLCRPLYMMTRLNGMPIQMFAISTATRDQCRRGQPVDRRDADGLQEGVHDARVAVEHPRPGRRGHQQRQQPGDQEQRPEHAGQAEPPVEEHREGQADRELEGDRDEDEDRGVDQRGRERRAVEDAGVVGEPRERSVAGDEGRDRVAPDAQVDVAVERVRVEGDQVHDDRSDEPPRRRLRPPPRPAARLAAAPVTGRPAPPRHAAARPTAPWTCSVVMALTSVCRLRYLLMPAGPRTGRPRARSRASPHRFPPSAPRSTSAGR